MSNKNIIKLKGRIRFSLESVERVKLISPNLIKGAEIEAVILDNKLEEIPISIFIQQMFDFDPDPEFNEVEDVFLEEFFKEHGCIRIKGYVLDAEEEKMPINIMYSSEIDFGAYIIDLGFKHKPSGDNKLNPRSN